ncbi:GTPase [Aureococcus anophagefferens]|nr:GTPase [Aureococcus anophagefferens]
MSSTKKRPPSGAELVALWRQPRRSRAICVLGHVDHGKSSLVDWLLAENGHIPARLAGTLRYLDDTVDEQERGITMRASAITILHRRVGPPPQAWETGDKGDRDYAITLVDSPGHIDFSHDACAATRLSDGAVIVVDVVEGVRVQTRFALRAACAERLAPILVLNKLDRLAVETADSPMEAFLRLRRVLENANAGAGKECFLWNARARNTHVEATLNHPCPAQANAALHEALQLHGCDDAFAARAAFAAEKGNVVFASALDGWGFTALQVAKVLLPRFPDDAGAATVLFGDFALDGDKVKRLRDPSYPDDAIFPTLVLAPLFQLLTGTALDDLGPWFEPDEKPSRKKRSVADDARACLRRKFPATDALCKAVVERVPPPEAALGLRTAALLPDSASPLAALVRACDADGLPLAYVAKNFSRPGSDAVACAVRVLSGTLRCGAALRVERAAVVVDAVSAMMGGELVPIDEARAGCVACLGPGVAAALGELKRATLADPSLDGVLAAPSGATALPLVRVAVAAQRRAESARLDRGLRLLQALAAATVEFRNDGEKVVGCVGELHLDQALRDLRAYCGGDEAIALDVSEPIVGFREGLAEPSGAPCKRPPPWRDEDGFAAWEGRTFADDWPSGRGGARGTFADDALGFAVSCGPPRRALLDGAAPSTVAFLTAEPRVVEPLCACELHCGKDALGKMFGLLSKRRGRVLEETLLEGTDLFVVRASLPAGAALGFGADLLQWTSGHGTAPQMAFDGFAVMDVDPFWTPTTEDEREEHGDVDDRSRATPRQAIAAVRPRACGRRVTLDKAPRPRRATRALRGEWPRSAFTLNSNAQARDGARAGAGRRPGPASCRIPPSG